MKRSTAAKKMPRKNSQKSMASKSKPQSSGLARSLVGVIITGLVILGAMLTQNLFFGNNPEVKLSSVGDSFTVDPSSVSMKMASSQVFTSYTQTETGQVPVSANWSIEGDDSEVSDYTDAVSPPASMATLEAQTTSIAGVTLENCKNSSSCTLHSGTQAAQFNLIAKSGENEVKTAVTVKKELPANPYTENFPDWAEKEVYALFDKGIMTGYENGKFGVNDEVTRAQIITLYYKLTKAYGFDVGSFLSTKNCALYDDVPETHFAYKPVCFAKYVGWLDDLKTSASSHLDPDAKILRHEVALVTRNMLTDKLLKDLFVRYVGVSSSIKESDIVGAFSGGDFTDVDENTPNRDSIGYVDILGIMKGSEDNFRPMATLTRVEIAKLMTNVMNLMNLAK